LLTRMWFEKVAICDKHLTVAEMMLYVVVVFKVVRACVRA